jgi:signal transduction histidine kinase
MRSGRLLLIPLCAIGWASYALAGPNPDSLLQQSRKDLLLSNYTDALAGFTALVHFAEENRNDSFYMAALTGIGDCHYYLRDKRTALKWYHAGKGIAASLRNQEREATFDYKISLMFIELGAVDSASYYASRAIGFFRRNKDYVQLSKALSAFADIHLNVTKDFIKAERLIEEALLNAQKTNNQEMIGFALIKYSFLHYYKGNFKKGLQYAEQAEFHYKQTGKLEDVLYAIMQKSFCQIMLGDTAAIHSMYQWFTFKDSVFQKDKANSVARLQALYQTERKERENKILQQQAQISRLQLQARNRTIIVLVALLAGVAMFGVWRYNAGRLKKKQRELEMLEQMQKDKERIARDLHDHVGGHLSFLVHSLEGITEDPPEKREALKTSMRQTLRNVIAGLRETIWAIHDEHIEATDFMDKLKVYVRNLFQHSAVQIHFSEELTAAKDLGPMQALNLYRICQEIIQNSFKHAHATDLWVQCTNKGEQLFIRIADNGSGFDAGAATSTGMGQENIRKRAAESQIDVQVESGAAGTSYTLIV